MKLRSSIVGRPIPIEYGRDRVSPLIRIVFSREGVFVTMDGETTKDDDARFEEAMRRIRTCQGEKSL